MISIGDCSCGKRCRAGSDKCASCEALDRKGARVEASDNNTPINKWSAKSGKTNQRYLNRLKTWKKGKKCEGHFAHDCSSVITCHHMAGKGNHYYDEWAEENDVPLTCDERFWKPLCLNAHAYITEHSKFAWENGYSFKRVADKMFQRTVND